MINRTQTSLLQYPTKYLKVVQDEVSNPSFLKNTNLIFLLEGPGEAKLPTSAVQNRNVRQPPRAARVSPPYACLKDRCKNDRERAQKTLETLEGSLSAVSKPNFASKYMLESSRRDLHNALFCTVLKAQTFCFANLKFVKISIDLGQN